MTTITLSNNGDTAFEKLIGHNKDILNNWLQLETSIFKDSSLSPHILEQVRRTLAFGNGCEYCMVKGGRANLSKHNQREQLATAFAELYQKDHMSISNGHFDLLKEEFNDREISELCSFISFITACQKLGRIFNLTEDLQVTKLTTMSELFEK